jgi:hypothetical protein
METDLGAERGLARETILPLSTIAPAIAALLTSTKMMIWTCRRSECTEAIRGPISTISSRMSTLYRIRRVSQTFPKAKFENVRAAFCMQTLVMTVLNCVFCSSRSQNADTRSP